MTITAKNYAAQAQRASIGISAKNSAHKAAIYMARTLPDAQHFALPDGGKVLDDGLRGLEQKCSSAFTSNRKGWAAGALEGYATSCAGRRAVTAAAVPP